MLTPPHRDLLPLTLFEKFQFCSFWSVSDLLMTIFQEIGGEIMNRYCLSVSQQQSVFILYHKKTDIYTSTSWKASSDLNCEYSFLYFFCRNFILIAILQKIDGHNMNKSCSIKCLSKKFCSYCDIRLTITLPHGNCYP